MRIISVVGARPQFVKLAPVCRAIARHNATGAHPIDDCIVHTGQHYDPSLSDVFFSELDIPRAAIDLGIGSGTHASQTARMLEGIETILRDRNPDAVVVYGDTNSTVAAALAAAKLHIAVVHVEAGLRSFNRRMPEEINRIVTDHVADWLLAPTPTAVRNLEAENLRARTIFTGDVMFDAVLDIRARTRGRPASGAGAGLEPYAYGVVTVHRAENTTPAILRELLEVLNEVATDHLPLVFPVHPRSAQLLKTELKDWRPAPRFRIVEPLGPLDMIRLVDGARMVLTDSGGLQKEAYFLDCPCVTLRQETEWIETVQAGANVVTGASRDRVLKAVRGWLEQPARPGFSNRPGDAPFGNGHAADAIVAAIASINTGSSGLRE